MLLVKFYIFLSISFHVCSRCSNFLMGKQSKKIFTNSGLIMSFVYLDLCLCIISMKFSFFPGR